MPDLLREFEQEQVKAIARPLLKAGDIVRVDMKVTEGEKTRLQAFEGTIIGIRGSGPSATFTVRRETGRFGVERIFPLYNPLITNIEIVKRQRVRHAKLGYLRQAGRRRVKEDELAMQRYIQEEQEKKRLVDLAAEAKAKEAEKKKREEETKIKKEAEEKAAEKKAEAAKTEEKPEEPKAEQKENK